MKPYRANILLILVTIIVFTLPACVPWSGQTPANENSADVIATSVAATLAAKAASEGSSETAAPPPSPTWTIHPTVTASAIETNFDYAGVSFYFNDLLADNISAGVNPGYYDEQALLWSIPEHREFVFNGWVLSDAFHTPAIRVYPVADFVAINENVANAFTFLQPALQAQPLNGDDLRVVDQFNAGQLYQSNVKAVQFQNGYGARWLAQYGQAMYPIGWPDLFYTFQGFTDDGQYYISVILPVNHPSLTPTELVVVDNDFFANYETYADGIQSQLNAESDNSFMPSLVLLDQLVASLLVGNP